MPPDQPVPEQPTSEDHLWLPFDIEGEPGDDVAVVRFRCVRCGLEWGTYTSLNMPQDYAEDGCTDDPA